MPGMGTGLRTNDPTIVSAFHSALLHQGLIVLLILAVAGITLNVLRSLQFRRAARSSDSSPGVIRPEGSPEPAARRLLRISFGLIWLFDGILQGQSSMPLGMVPQVVRPTTAASPTWVQHLVNAGATSWSYHPVQAAAAAVWIQIGIGIWLLVVPRGSWSRAERSGERRVGSGSRGCSASPSGGSSPLVSRGCSARRARCSSTAPPAPSSPSPSGPGRPLALGRIVLRVLGVFFVGMAAASGLARSGLLERTDPIGRCGHAHGNGPADGSDTSASNPLVVGYEFCVVRRKPRVGRQSLRRNRLGRDWCRLSQRPAPRSSASP